MSNPGLDPSNGTKRASADAAARGTAAWIILGSAVGAVALGTFTLWLVREQLHIGCGFAQMEADDTGTWMCSDGIAYVWVAVTLGGMTIVSTLVGALIAGLLHHERSARTLLVILAGTMASWVLGWTWYGSSELVSAVPASTESIDYWFASVLPAAIASGLGIISAIAALVSQRRAARIFLWIGAGAMLAATVLQPGLAINMLPAAGLLAAAAVRAAALHAPEAGSPRALA